MTIHTIIISPSQALAANLIPVIPVPSVEALAAAAAALGSANAASISASAAQLAASQVDLGALDAAVTTSTTQAGIAVASASGIVAAQAVTLAARDVTTTARDAAFINANVFATEVLGRAAVADGVQFQVVSADGLTITRFRRDSASVSVAVATYPSNLNVEALSAATPQIFESLDPLIANVNLLLSSNGRVVAVFPDPAIAALSAQAVTQDVFESLDSSYAVAFLDTERRVLAGVPALPADAAVLAAVQNEVVAARATSSSLANRLNAGLTPYGDPIGPRAGVWSLRETRYRLRKLALAESVQFVIGLIGDSYTQSATRYAQPLAKTLQDQYGMAGVGWIGFGWFGAAAGTWTAGSQPSGKDGSVRPDLVTILEMIGAWTCSYNSGANNTPSLSRITSSTANDYVRFTVPATHTGATLFYAGDGTGVIAISWDDGATYGANISLSVVGAANFALTGLAVGTARIRVVSGNVSLAGVDLRNAANGVRVHKLGGSGSNTTQWAAVTQATWGAQMLALGCHAHQVMHGTNDQGGSTPTATFAANLATIFNNLNAVLPYSDKLIVMPPENQRTNNTIAMPLYATAAREYALANDVAYMDLQFYFGPVANNAFAYANANAARPWYAADLIHPDPNTGGRVMVDAEIRLLTLA